MDDTELPEIFMLFTKQELQILTYAIASSQPLSKELEAIQFRLYHKLIAKLNDEK